MPTPTSRVASLLALLGALLPAAAAAETRERFGAIAGVGVGPQYAGVGAQLQLFAPVPLAPLGQPLALVAGAAFGTPGTLEGRTHVAGSDQRLGGFALSAAVSAGRVHRLCLGGGWGALSGRGVAVEGLVVDSVTEYGAFLEAGYEMLADNGIFLRVLPLGISWLPPARWRPDSDLDWAFSLGVGWKPW